MVKTVQDKRYGYVTIKAESGLFDVSTEQVEKVAFIST